MEPIQSLLKRIYEKYDLSLTREEKLLCLVPVIGAYIDYFSTLLLAGSSNMVLARESNTSVKTYMASNFSLFILLVGSPILIFSVFFCLITLLKLSKYKKELQYASVFIYFGYRIAGGLTWLV